MSEKEAFFGLKREGGINRPNAEPAPGDIGHAVSMMRAGVRMRRRGWNGKGMYVCFQAGYPDGIAINANTARATGEAPGTVHRFLPYLMMRAADGSFVPWLASQTDILADDWEPDDGSSVAAP